MVVAVRVFPVWLMLIGAEVVHGVARTMFLAPVVGDLRAGQIGVFSGSLLILLITNLAIRWMGTYTRRSLLVIGMVWVFLTLLFEIGFRTLVLGYSWDRLALDYNLLAGGWLSIGLAVMMLSQIIAARLHGASAMNA